MDNNIKLTICKTKALGFRFMNHTYVVGEDTEPARGDYRYGCFGACRNPQGADDETPVVTNNNALDRIAAHVCFWPWKIQNEYTNYALDTCGIIYLVMGVCHQMANRIANSNYTTIVNACNDHVGGGWASLIYGTEGYLYPEYKCTAVAMYVIKCCMDARLVQDMTADSDYILNAVENQIDSMIAEKGFDSPVFAANKQKFLEMISPVCSGAENMSDDAGYDVFRRFILSLPVGELVGEEQNKLHERIGALKITDDEKASLTDALDKLVEYLINQAIKIYGTENLSENDLKEYINQAKDTIGKYFTKCHGSISEDAFVTAFGQPYEKFKELTYNINAAEADTECAANEPPVNDTPSNDDTDPPSDPQPALIEQIYAAINEVIGGTNENQMFCMMSPGTTLNVSDYKYDTKGKKPATVAANESRLVNKLFDACHVTGSDNGRSLPTQFLSALNVLTPKLNPELAAAKNALRTMLMTKIKYEFEEGTVEATFQQIFYRLYEEWVKEKQKWAEAQSAQRAVIEAKYTDNTDESKQKIEDEYLEWYHIKAESYLLAIEAKLGKILGLFSIDDMQVIEGVLNSGVGSELYEAKTSVLNAKQYNPDGGATYPVTLVPSDWTKFLNSNFKAVDLLETPDALLQTYRTLTSRRLSLTNQIARFRDLDQTSKLDEAIKRLNEAKSAYDSAASELSKDYVDGTVSLIQTIAGFVSGGSEIDSFIYDMQCAKANNSADKEKKTKITADQLKDFISKTQDKQQAFVDAAQVVADAGREAIADKTANLSEMIKPLLTELDSVNSQIAELEPKIKETNIISKEPTELTAQSVENEFMEVLIHTDASSTKSSGSMSSSSSASSCGASFWFGGYSQSRSSSSSDFKEFSESNNTKIDIGFHVTKVDVNRAWFNPGVFMLSNDMFNLSGKRISYNPAEHPGESSEKEIFKYMNNSVFSCFPVAFVIAKDVTIRLTSETAISGTVRSAMQEQVSKGGGVFCFSASSSSSSSSESHSSKVQNTSKGLTIKFPGPQILGYYLEKTPADESKFFASGDSKDEISISDFVAACKQMLDTIYQPGTVNN